MKSSNTSSLLNRLASLKLALVLMVMFAAAIAFATFVEVRYGAIGAQVVVYKARWFEIILAVMVLSACCRIIVELPKLRRRIPFMLVHVGVVVILLSAFVTRYFGEEGTMSIREGASADFMYSREDHIQLRIDDETAAFPVRLYKSGPQSLARNLTLTEQDWRVEVLEFWSHFEQSWVDGEGGVPVLDLVLRSGGGDRSVALTVDEPQRLGEARLRLMAGELPQSAGGDPIGSLRVRIASDSHSIPIPDRLPSVVEAGGFTFEFTEWQADFKVGREGDDPAAGHAGSLSLINPMIRVNVTDSQGRSGERVLFAWHPEFSMGHSGAESGMEDIDLLYELNRGIDFAWDQEGRLAGRSTIPLNEIDMHSGEINREIAAGEEFAVAIGGLYVDLSGESAFLPRTFLTSAVLEPAQSLDENRPAGVRLRVTASGDSPPESREFFLSRFNSHGETFNLCGIEIAAGYGPVRIELPYRIFLDDFEMETYPGSDNPAAYSSHVQLYDEELGIDGRPETIFMNNPLVHRGTRHYQSSYDQDRRGTVLSVNHDPGTLPTYIGYFIISLGFLYSLVKRSFGGRSRRPVKTAGKGRVS